jgi:hypothetical protein
MIILFFIFSRGENFLHFKNKTSVGRSPYFGAVSLSLAAFDCLIFRLLWLEFRKTGEEEFDLGKALVGPDNK